VATAAALTLAPALVALRLGRDGRSKASSPTSPTDESDQPSQADQPNWRNAAGPSLATRRIRSHLLPLVESLVRRRRVAIGVAWAALIAIAVLGASRLAISTDIILWFPQGTAIRDDYERIRSELSGITPVNVMISAKTKQAPDVTAPPVLERIDRLAAALEAHPNVGKALSIADPIRMLHREFASAGDVLPEDRDLIEQYLVLLSGEARIDDVLSFDRRSANVLLRVDDNGSEEIMALGEWVTAWWERFGDSAYEVRTTGIMYEFGRAEEAIAYGQIRGLLLAAAAIGLVLLLIFRDLRTAALAMTVNLVPIGLGFGGMGLLGIPLAAATVCIGSTALGIAVDDTIHVVTGHRQGLAAGLSSREALGRALERVLPALVFTTISISAAFAVLGLSGFSLIRNLGIVTAVLVVLCLVADLTLLPALLARGERGGDPSPSSSEVGATLKG
jgi:predicted RND superfamily exporter protein